jgi:3-phenylpropionate/cinnamic acid dioxygenase small subunit
MTLSALDHEEIRSLLARYNFGIDFGDADAWVACFADDGVMRVEGVPADHPFARPVVGRDALRTFIEGFAQATGGRTRHWNTNIEITDDGAGGAEVRCYLMTLVLAEESPAFGTTGVYHDRVVKRDGRWVFLERVVDLGH